MMLYFELVGKKSFTLIELIVVIAIIAILAAIIAPNAFKAIEKAKITNAVADFRALKTAVYACYADTGLWAVPAGYTGLNIEYTVLLNDPSDPSAFPAFFRSYLSRYTAGWDGPYIDRGEVTVHPWAGLYQFNSGRNWGGLNNRDLVITFTNWCIRGGGGYTCGVPTDSAQRMDALLDDNDLSTGDLRTMSFASGYMEIGGVLVYDVY